MNDIRGNVGQGRGALLVGWGVRTRGRGVRGGWANKHARGVVVVMNACACNWYTRAT